MCIRYNRAIIEGELAAARQRGEDFSAIHQRMREGGTPDNHDRHFVTLAAAWAASENEVHKLEGEVAALDAFEAAVRRLVRESQ